MKRKKPVSKSAFTWVNLYRYAAGNDIKWNFGKFLVDGRDALPPGCQIGNMHHTGCHQPVFVTIRPSYYGCHSRVSDWLHGPILAVSNW
jgi:hypothetical protein